MDVHPTPPPQVPITVSSAVTSSPETPHQMLVMSSRLRSALESLGTLEEERPAAFLTICAEIEKEVASLPTHACSYCKTTFNKRKEKLQHIQDSHQDVLQSFLVTVKVGKNVNQDVRLLTTRIFFWSPHKYRESQCVANHCTRKSRAWNDRSHRWSRLHLN